MKLTFSNFVFLLIRYFIVEKGRIGATANEIFQIVDPDNPTFKDSHGYSDIYYRGRDFPPEVKKRYFSIPFSRKRELITTTIFSRIPANKTLLLKETLVYLIEHDATIRNECCVFLDLHLTKGEVVGYNGIEPLDFLTETFSFALSRENEKPNFDVDEIDNVINELSRGDNLTHQTALSDFLTVNAKSFDSVFKKIDLLPIEGLFTPNDFEAYHLAIQDQSFVMENLKELLKKNIGNYVFTKMRLDQYVRDNDVASINLDAMHRILKIEKYTGEDFANILLYVFLEHILKAPKIMSGYEILGNGQCDFTGIHLLNRKTEKGDDFYQVILGTSCLSGGLSNAIKDSIDKLGQIKKKRASVIRVIDSIDLNSKFSPEQALGLKRILIPSDAESPRPDTGLGAFIGYKPNIAIDAPTTEENIRRAESELKSELEGSLTLIKEALCKNELSNSSVYLYLVPFNDPKRDFDEILEDIIEGN